MAHNRSLTIRVKCRIALQIINPRKRAAKRTAFAWRTFFRCVLVVFSPKSLFSKLGCSCILDHFALKIIFALRFTRYKTFTQQGFVSTAHHHLSKESLTKKHTLSGWVSQHLPRPLKGTFAELSAGSSSTLPAFTIKHSTLNASRQLTHGNWWQAQHSAAEENSTSQQLESWSTNNFEASTSLLYQLSTCTSNGDPRILQKLLASTLSRT